MGSRIREEKMVDKCEEIRLEAWGIVRAALAAVDPEACVRRSLVRHGDVLWAGTHTYDLHRVRVVGMGKAAGAMVRAVEEILADRIDTGLVVTADGYRAPTDRVEVIEAGHPVPDERGLAAARRIAALVEGAEEGDLVVVLISGGGSALLTLPADGLSLGDLARTNELLLRSGAPIAAMNAVRKHLDQLKGGNSPAGQLPLGCWLSSYLTSLAIPWR
jgi:glycerate-2-kinase